MVVPLFPYILLHIFDYLHIVTIYGFLCFDVITVYFLKLIHTVVLVCVFVFQRNKNGWKKFVALLLHLQYICKIVVVENDF